jgi:hypothetical protein
MEYIRKGTVDKKYENSQKLFYTAGECFKLYNSPLQN